VVFNCVLHLSVSSPLKYPKGGFDGAYTVTEILCGAGSTAS
jgi:hypothetical protein